MTTEHGATPSHNPDFDNARGIERAARGPKWFLWFNRTVAVISASGLFVLGFLALTRWHAGSGLTAVNPKRVTRSQTHILSPLITDGTRILYPAYMDGKYSLATVPVAGGQSTPIMTSITNPELCDLEATGEKMLLRELLHSRDQDEPLYIHRGDGVAQRVGNILAYDAAWYRDGQDILFSSDGVVYLTDMSGGSRRRLFSVPGNAFWFRWSADRKRLRFTLIDKRSEETSVWEVAADGSQPHRLFPELHYHLCCGSWTPDGKYFLFQARVGSTFQIWAMRDGRSYLRLFSRIRG